MSDDFKNMIESNIESYVSSIRTHIDWMVKDLEGVEVMGNKLLQYNTWRDFGDVLNYLEYLQSDLKECEKLIHKAMEYRELLKRYSECVNDE